MKVEIDNYIHEVIYIEYQDGIPWEVVSMYYVTTSKEPYWRCDYWDVFPEKGDKKDLRIYNHGSGGDPNEICAPKYADGVTKCQYWISDKAKLKGVPENISKLAKPKRIKGYLGNTSINPFKIAEITFSNEYCVVCAYDSVDFCHEHMYDDDEGNVRYRHDDSYAE